MKKTHRFALITASSITAIVIIIMAISIFFIPNKISFLHFSLISVSIFITSVIIVQYRAEKFIYLRIKQLHDDISILHNKSLAKEDITTNIEKLSRTIKNSVVEYIDTKQEQIADLTEKDSFRKEYIGNIAHELKTPLFTVQGYILTLIDGAWDDDDEIREKYLKRANKGVERLCSIVKDLDMITKLETEGMILNITRINIVELIQTAFDLLEINAKKRDITLSFDKTYPPIFIEGDIERLEQVLTNLIVNSIKYGEIGGKTTIRIEDYSEKRKVIKVIDDGEGIKNKHINRLFERFYRIDRSRSREQGGSGLGLSIVKHIIEAHNGKIMVKSTYGKGSEFYFTLKKSKIV